MRLRPAGLMLLVFFALLAQAGECETWIRTLSDLNGLEQSQDARDLLAAIGHPRVTDATRESFSPFVTSGTHRFRVQGRWNDPRWSVEVPAWCHAGTLRLGVTKGLLNQAVTVLDQLVGPGRSYAGGVVRSVRLKGAGVAGLVDVVLTVEFTRKGHHFCGPLVLRVRPDRREIQGMAGADSQLVRFLDGALADPHVAYFLPHVKEKPDPENPALTATIIQMDQRGIRLDCRYDARLDEYSVLALGGLYAQRHGEPAGQMLSYSLALADVAKAPFAELTSLVKDKRFTEILTMDREPVAHLHVQQFQAGCFATAFLSGNRWVRFAIGQTVDFLESQLVPRAEPTVVDNARSRRAEEFLLAARAESTAAQLGALRARWPENLYLLVGLAEEARNRKDAGEARERARLAVATRDRLVALWAEVRKEAAAGHFPVARDKCEQMLELCPSDPELWQTTRLLRAASGEELPPKWPAILGAWEGAGQGLTQGAHALLPRLVQLGAPGIPAGAPVAPKGVEKAPADWNLEPDDGSADPSALRAGPSRTLRPRMPVATGAVVIRVPGAATLDLPDDPALLRRIVERLGGLEVGGARLPAGPLTASLLAVRPADLLADPFQVVSESTRRLRRACLTLPGEFLARAMLRGGWLVEFTRGEGTTVAHGLYLPELDRGRLDRLRCPAGAITNEGLRRLLSTRFAATLPALGPSAIDFRDNRLAVQPVQPVPVALVVAALKERTPFARFLPTEIALGRCSLSIQGGNVRL